MISIRREFIRLLLVATAPLLLLLGYTIYNEYQTAYREAEKTAINVAEMTASATQDFVVDVRMNLDYLARQPAIRAMNPAQCGSAITDLHSVDQRFASIITTDREGFFVCSATGIPAGQKPRVSDTEMHQRVVGQGEFRISRPLQARTSGRWLISLANPVRDAAGEIVGSVAIGVDLLNWRFLARTISLPEGSVIALLTGDGTVIARSPGPEGRIGHSALSSEAGRAALRVRDGTANGTNEFGEGRIYAFKPVVGTDWIVAVGLSLQAARANSHSALLRSLVLAMLALLVAGFSALMLKRKIVGPIREMARVARSHAAGDTDAIVQVGGGPSELVELAQDMNRSTESRANAESALRRAQHVAKLSHLITRPDGTFESWSDSLPTMLGTDFFRLPKTTREWLKNVHPDDRSISRAKAIDAARTGGRTEMEYRVQRADGEWIYVRHVMEPLAGQTDAPDNLRWFTTLQDVTTQKAADERIRRLNRVYAVLSGINALIVRVHTRDELFKETCRIAVEAGGFRLAWLGIVDRDLGQIEPLAWYGIGGDDLIRLVPVSLKEAASGGGGIAARVVVEQTPMISEDIATDSRIDPVLRSRALELGFRSLVVLPLLIADEAVGVLALYAGELRFFDHEEMKLLHELAGDIAFALDHIEKEAKLDYLAYYDQVTGLANRTLFHERLEQSLTAAGREGRKMALITLDIERFKAINDTVGRQAGDVLLKRIAERMVSHVPDISWLARTGADHFAIMTPDIQNADDVARIAEKRIEELFGLPYRIGESQLSVSAKLGIAVFPGDGADAETLFRNAEAALKKAKANGDRYLFYTEAMNERIAGKLLLEGQLRQALVNDEFVLHYQPKVDSVTGSIVGVEALIRWQSPELGLISPMQFIPLMEETGLILPVGSWALRQATLDHRNWINQGLKAPRIAVNVSSSQLQQHDFVGIVTRAISEGVSPPSIDLEITESLAMEDMEGNIVKLNALRDLGLSIAIDDFGTGYSSLGYLAKLPVQALKIDRSFVVTMLADSGSMTLVQTMISLAHSLNLKVIAEGVEDEEQATVLRQMRCDEMQGFHFSHPLSLDEMTALLQRAA